MQGNDTRTVTEVQLGAQNMDAGTRGILYFDDFDSRRFSYIGLLPNPGVPDIQPTAQAGWTGTSYSYSATKPHAVTAAGSSTYTYDQNGNMTCRVENGVSFAQVYNAENRLATVKKLGSGTCASIVKVDTQWDFTYDGDGERVRQVVTVFNQDTPQTIASTSTTAYFMGGLYEVTGSQVRKYYAIAGQTVAMDDGSLKYLLTDHLGSVVAVTNTQGAILEQQRYLPFGGVRTIPNATAITATDFTYTGQRANSYIKLLDYHFRWYDPELGRFISLDSIIPQPYNPQSWNRYSYVLNGPINLVDPSGHFGKCRDGWSGYKCKREQGKWAQLGMLWTLEAQLARISNPGLNSGNSGSSDKCSHHDLDCMLNGGDDSGLPFIPLDPTQNPQTLSVTQSSSEQTCVSCGIEALEGFIHLAEGLAFAAVSLYALGAVLAVGPEGLIAAPIFLTTALVGIDWVMFGVQEIQHATGSDIEPDPLALVHLFFPDALRR